MKDSALEGELKRDFDEEKDVQLTNFIFSIFKNLFSFK